MLHETIGGLAGVRGFGRAIGHEPPGSFRQTLHSGGLALVEQCYIAPSSQSPSGYEARYQIGLPYHGLFKYMVGKRSWTIDPNRVLFVSRGWEYREDHPHPTVGHGAILINLTPELLEDACGAPDPARIAAFASGSRVPTIRLRLLMHQMLRRNGNALDPLWNDEWIANTIAEAVDAQPPRLQRSSKVVERAKEFLHAAFADRLSLAQVAQQVGVNPIYLTQEFTRSEGIPLYRYQTHLRLNKALLELPCCDDITGLALDLGFSSHSHFTSVFRNAFGTTPSAYRRSEGVLPVLS